MDVVKRKLVAIVARTNGASMATLPERERFLSAMLASPAGLTCVFSADRKSQNGTQDDQASPGKDGLRGPKRWHCEPVLKQIVLLLINRSRGDHRISAAEDSFLSRASEIADLRPQSA